MDPAEWWRARRGPTVGAGDGWSGGGGAYRAWMGAKSGRARPIPSGAARQAAGPVRSGGPPNPRAARRRTLAVGRRRHGRALGLVAAGLAAVLLGAPLAWSGRASPCAAAEVALMDDAIGQGSRFEESKRRVANWAGPDGKLLSHGRVGWHIAAEEHTGWPPPLGCTALFWRARADIASFPGCTAVLVRALPAVRC